MSNLNLNDLSSFIDSFGDHTPPAMDSSNTVIGKDCARKYFYRVVLGRDVKEKPTQVCLDFGTAYHKFRETIASKDENKRVLPVINQADENKALAYVMTAHLPKPVPTPGRKDYSFLDNTRLAESAKVGLDYYRNQLAEDKFHYLRTEQTFNIQTPDGVIIGGKVDVIAEWNDNIWILDYKTTTKPKGLFIRQFNPNDQVQRYIYAFSQLHGKPVKGLIIEALQNDKNVKPNIYTHSEPYLESKQEMWLNDLMMFHERMKGYVEKNSFPMEEGYKCNFCDFRQVCSQSTLGGMKAILKMNYIENPWRFDAENEVD